MTKAIAQYLGFWGSYCVEAQLLVQHLEHPWTHGGLGGGALCQRYASVGPGTDGEAALHSPRACTPYVINPLAIFIMNNGEGSWGLKVYLYRSSFYAPTLCEIPGFVGNYDNFSVIVSDRRVLVLVFPWLSCCSMSYSVSLAVTETLSKTFLVSSWNPCLESFWVHNGRPGNKANRQLISLTWWDWMDPVRNTGSAAQNNKNLHNSVPSRL